MFLFTTILAILYVINLGVDYMQGYYISKPSFIPEDISDKIKKELKICHENRNDVV